VKIALAMIVGDGSDEDLQTCIDSAAPFVDGVFIAFNGKGSLARVQERHRELWPNVPLTVETFEWEENFATARNQSFAMVPKDEYDFCMWLDSDDVLINGELLRDMLANISPKAQAVFLKYEYGYDFVNRVPMVEQWRERIMRTTSDWKWKYPVHEVCHSRPGVVLTRRTDVWVRHRRQEGQRNEEVRMRNRRILTRARKEEPDEPRYVYYLANEVYAEAHTTTDEEQRENLFRSAIMLYTEFVGRSRWDDDTYIANANMADCFRAIGEHNKAIDADMQGIKLHPTWPNSYVGICKACLSLADWDKLRFWATLCIEYASKPDTSQIYETPNAGFLPYLLRGIANEESGRLREAESDYQKALSFAPYEAQVQARLEGLRKPSQKPQEAEVPPTPMGKIIPIGRGSGDRKIAFVTRTLFEAWNPVLAAQHGAGGAETCIMKLAPRFAKDGWDVSIFGTPGDYAGVDPDGIKWINCNDFEPAEPYDVVIASRIPEMFDAKINSKVKILWCHDVNTGEDFRYGQWGDRFNQVDHIVGLSKWHIAHMSLLYDVPIERFAIVPNGIDPERFTGSTNNGRRMDRFVWTSSPDRGVDVALTLWPKIREKHPDARLDVYYGFTAIDKIIALSDKRSGTAYALLRFKANVMDLLEEIGGEDGGVYWHDRVSQDELAEAYQKAGTWLYPSYFLETFCISALETQAAGVIPASTYAGALPETVALKDHLIVGHPNNVTYQTQYLDLIERILSAPEETQEAMRTRGREFALTKTWDHAYSQWVKLIEEGTTE
jgi:glycosyltransferase involved in cell wall biosynthesis